MKITVNKLVKKYGDLYALDHVDLDFDTGTGIYALLGPNGAGKTTLMDIISTVLRPTDGEVLLDNINVLKLGKSYRSIIGYLPQNPPFYHSYIVRDFLRYIALLKDIPQASITDEIMKALSTVNLEDVIDKKISALSGGMRQRLGIAQAIMNDPSIIILDEPTAGLDPKERINLKNIIARIAKNRIIILSTHIVSDVEELAKQVIMMDKGKIITFGSPKELTNSLIGKVWIIPENQGGEVLYTRTFAEVKPGEGAEKTQPSLDDVYLYHFGKGEIYQ